MVATLYRKKPVEISAWRVHDLLTFNELERPALPKQVLDAVNNNVIIFHDDFVHIITLEGIMRGDWNDWLICGVLGEFYPCKSDAFERTYEEVDSILLDQDDRVVANLPYGCHCEIECMDEGFEPDGCVIDTFQPEHCIYAKHIDSKEKCKYWRQYDPSKYKKAE
ncbi:MAG: hypothetical protein P4L79_09945 [Legionella sp.]|uniref:hypothetical protein n=1 Tax=Legionella sp. TaxID=459 RepID=UPI00283FF7E6|nr:hypothetical protein [Legionella sp.]